MKTALSDKKIFYGLVTLIVLTIFLIVGITFIQRPQTTGSEAQTADQAFQDAVNVVPDSQKTAPLDEKPTSIPLPGVEEISTGGDTTETGTTETSTTETVTSETGTATDTETTTNQNNTQNGTNEVQESTTTTSTPTTAPAVTTTITKNIADEDLIEDDGTCVQLEDGSQIGNCDILADAGTTTTGTTTTGSTQTQTGAIGGPNDTQAYTTSTPVPTAAKQLPVTGTVELTLLIFAVSLALVVLGLAL